MVVMIARMVELVGKAGEAARDAMSMPSLVVEALSPPLQAHVDTFIFLVLAVLGSTLASLETLEDVHVTLMTMTFSSGAIYVKVSNVEPSVLVRTVYNCAGPILCSAWNVPLPSLIWPSSSIDTDTPPSATRLQTASGLLKAGVQRNTSKGTSKVA